MNDTLLNQCSSLGVSSMMVGELAVFLCSPRYGTLFVVKMNVTLKLSIQGYGQDGFGPRVPPNTALRCEVCVFHLLKCFANNVKD
jgi:hypothetical protein